MYDDQFKPIDGFPAYRVSRDGEVESRWLKAGRHSRLTDTWRPLKPVVRPDRCTVNLSGSGGKKQRRIHRIVLESFLGPCPPGMVCCHNDGDPTNNRIDNLRWDTQQANVDDALRHGTRAVGSRCNSKLTEADVIEIRRRWAEGAPAKELASRFGVSARNIWAITSGKTWRHVPLTLDPHDPFDDPPPPLECGREGAA